MIDHYDEERDLGGSGKRQHRDRVASTVPYDSTPDTEQREHRSESIGISDPSLWAIEHYGPHLISRLRPWGFSRHSGASSYHISLAYLQRMKLRVLQIQLVKHCQKISDGSESPGWRDDLRDYVQALQDHDYMNKCASLPRDPFIITGERRVDRDILAAAIPHLTARADPEPILTTRWEQDGVPIAVNRSRLRHSRYSRRVGVAAFGVAFLIGPMWLMALQPGAARYVALASATAFIVAFGLVMAYVLEEDKEVLSSTAAYAAVLVVFVGLTAETSA